jgi:NADP-dependent 3-hydroxy acid dehydrogenase YdfG
MEGIVETEFSLVRLKDADKAQSVYKGIDCLSSDDIGKNKDHHGEQR